jgi:hypothetical protein
MSETIVIDKENIEGVENDDRMLRDLARRSSNQSNRIDDEQIIIRQSSINQSTTNNNSDCFIMYHVKKSRSERVPLNQLPQGTRRGSSSLPSQPFLAVVITHAQFSGHHH